MALFKEPPADPKRDAHRAHLLVHGRGPRYNIQGAPFVVPIVGALFAIAVAAYALSRPSVIELLRGRDEPQWLEIDLE